MPNMLAGFFVWACVTKPSRTCLPSHQQQNCIMADRSIHYEAAFEAFLRDRAIPYVAVDEAKKALFANAKLKSFDFVVYSRSGPNLLIDVKGRQARSRGRGGFETW